MSRVQMLRSATRLVSTVGARQGQQQHVIARAASVVAGRQSSSGVVVHCRRRMLSTEAEGEETAAAEEGATVDDATTDGYAPTDPVRRSAHAYETKRTPRCLKYASILMTCSHTVPPPFPHFFIKKQKELERAEWWEEGLLKGTEFDRHPRRRTGIVGFLTLISHWASGYRASCGPHIYIYGYHK